MVYRFFVHGGKQRSIKEQAGLVPKGPKMIRESTSENLTTESAEGAESAEQKNKIKREKVRPRTEKTAKRSLTD